MGLDLVSEEEGKHVFLKAGMAIHFALEIEQADYEVAKNILIQTGIYIEKEMSWGSGGKSIYFRDPVGNLVEIVTKGQWSVQD